jgi:3-methyladenine DNA glycosylase AlkC
MRKPKSRDEETKRAPVPRKGARSRAALDPTVLRELNAGRIATASLSEWLAIDMSELAGAALSEVLGKQELDALCKKARNARTLGIVQRMQTLGSELGAQLGTSASRKRALARLAKHPSDTVRGWVCYAIAADARLDLEHKLEALRPFAADAHFGVRELAWMAARPHVSAELQDGLRLLTDWTHEPDENLRRFASETTRPRGVWCAHIEALKREPELGLPLLGPLRADPSRYVQNSVANWLNDAGKTRSDFVDAVCKRWSRQSKSTATSYIVRRARRNLS